VVTGGGTAGHVLPALAVAGALAAAGHEADTIHYVGCTRGIETRLLPETPYPHTFYDVVGFQRSLSRRNLAFAPKMWRARSEAIALLRTLDPEVVVSVGGYASMPAVFAARKLGVPVVVVSYDFVPGRASQLAARSATACAVAFENSPLPNATVTGAPVRQEILTLDRTRDRGEARRRLGIPDDRFLVAVMGGSLGSGVLNAAIASYANAHRDDDGLAIRQVAGERFVDEIDGVGAPGAPGLLHQVVGYEDDMASVYAAADVLVGRGGASTVHEVAVTGIPAILIPWSGAADDHQTENVRWLSDAEGAVLMTETALAADASHLGDAIEGLRDDVEARAGLSAAASRRGEVHRSGALASLVERVALASTAR
jgi:UDP-N-acetylglucosamine--N-acetylmuramyl-(pentapeptide) pyrophosphoryl-undecaprenol N-acetylglucosamine transferase